MLSRYPRFFFLCRYLAGTGCLRYTLAARLFHLGVLLLVYEYPAELPKLNKHAKGKVETAYWLDASTTKRPPLHRFMLQLHHLRTWPCHDQFQKLAGVYHIVGDRDARALRNISITILRNKLLYLVLEMVAVESR